MLRDRVRAIVLLVAGFFASMIALGLVAADRAPPDRGPIVLAGGFAAFAIWAVLAARRGARPSPEGVRLQYVVRSRFVPWEDVAYFGLAETRNWFGERLRKPLAVLRSGERIVVPGADKVSWFGERPGSKRFGVLDELERLRSQRGPW